MATCSAWYYTKPPWHDDPMTIVKGTSQTGVNTKGKLETLAKKNADAKVLLAYLNKVAKDNQSLDTAEERDRDPFGCAEPDAVRQLIEKGAELNQIFIGMTTELRYSAVAEGDIDKRLKPCVNCQKWMTARLRDGNYMIDMGELNQFVRTTKGVSW